MIHVNSKLLFESAFASYKHYVSAWALKARCVCESITFVETLLQVAVLRLEVLQLLSQILDQDLKPEILTIL